MSLWVKEVLKDSGIDTSVFSAGSTRAAATSKAAASGATGDDIIRCGGWNRESTFRKWYKNLSEEITNP